MVTVSSQTKRVSSGASLLHAGFSHDPDVAVVATAPPAEAKVLVVDAYGGAESAFAFLAHAPARVHVAALVDAMGIEALLALKSAAFASIERKEALKLLGLLRASRRERSSFYMLVRAGLPEAARQWWDARRELVFAGVYNQCAEAAFGRLLRNLLHTHLASNDYRTLLYGEREDRLATFDASIRDSVFWKGALRMCALRGRLASSQERAIDAFTASDPVQALRQMVSVGLWSSPLWARAFCNDSGVLATLPRHLRSEGFATVRAHLDRLHPQVSDVEGTLAALPERSLHAVDLANLADHLERPHFARLLTQVGNKLRPGGRVTFTAVQTERLDAPHPATLARDHTREAAANELDRAPILGTRRVFLAS